MKCCNLTVLIGMQFVQRQYPFWFHEQWCIAARFHSSLMSRNQECLISTWTACLQRLNSGLWKDNGLQHGSTREVVLTGHFVTFIMNAAPAHLSSNPSHAEEVMWCPYISICAFKLSTCLWCCFKRRFVWKSVKVPFRVMLSTTFFWRHYKKHWVKLISNIFCKTTKNNYVQW